MNTGADWKTLPPLKSTILILLLILSCRETLSAQAPSPPLKDFAWMVGKWKNTERNNSFEVWEFNKDSTALTGYSYSTREGDSLITERLRIIVENNTCYYIADVPDNGRPIRFTLVRLTPGNFRWENPRHDYPKYIDYKLEAPGKLRAEVGASGRSQVFHFERFLP